ncbi:MAG: hypothetical protein JW940_13325 [Polyangiaceae bacterium]|nr:hypothetical protein [Polyangiaceae bacterium]
MRLMMSPARALALCALPSLTLPAPARASPDSRRAELELGSESGIWAAPSYTFLGAGAAFLPVPGLELGGGVRLGFGGTLPRPAAAGYARTSWVASAGSYRPALGLRSSSVRPWYAICSGRGPSCWCGAPGDATGARRVDLARGPRAENARRARPGSLPAEERAVLTRARSPMEARLAVIRQQSDLQLELDAANSDLERLKEASAAVSGRDTGDASAPLVARLLQTHDAIRKMEARKRALEKELEGRTRALGEVLSGLNAFRPAILEQRRQAEAAATSP